MAGKRYPFIDHFRGWAVIVMIEVHATNAWLADSLRHTSWFPYLNNLNGLVAPSFLFIAGVSFSIIAARRFELISKFSAEFVALLRRFAWIWLIGYLLHLPRVRWAGGFPSVVPEDLAGFYQVDVLQTIAVSLIVMLFLCALLRSRSRFYLACAALAVAGLLLTPALWRQDFSETVHPFFANYLNGRNNPLFPLFPWSAFVFSGALAGGVFLDDAAKNREGSGILKLMVAGIVLFGAGSILRDSTLFTFRNFWLESPQWVMMRLGMVVALFVLFWRLEKRGMPGAAPVHVLGSESLVAYVVHLIGIYWITGEKALFSLLKYRDYLLSETIGLYAVLLIGTTAITYSWILIRGRSPYQRETGKTGASGPGSSDSR